MINVRDAVTADAAVVAEFNARLAHETEDRGLDPGRLIPGVTAMLANPESHGRYFIAERDGQAVGQLAVTYEWSDWRNGWFWWFQSVYIAPEARRSGVFSTLFSHVQTLARARDDICGLRLYVLNRNDTASRTYQALGMTASGYQVMEIDFHDVNEEPNG